VSGRSPVLAIAGVMAAVVLAFVTNVLGARHFRRWDWTTDARWSLSPATLETLRTLERRVDVWAIGGGTDRGERSLVEMLESYRAASSRIDVHWIDPDRDAVQLMDLQRQFGLEAGPAEDGHTVIDAVVVVASGDKHWFLTAEELFEETGEDRVRPREERALTRAIRGVLGGDKPRLCFTVGHGELSLEGGRGERDGLGALRDLLEKSNYELVAVDAAAHEPFDRCSVVVVAGVRTPFAPEAANRLRAWLLSGGSLLAAVGPLDADTPTGMTDAGLDPVLAPFGIALEDDLVHDLAADVSIPETHGEGFFVTARPHPVTSALTPTGAQAHPPRAALFLTRSVRTVDHPGASPVDLLVTGPDAFAKRDIRGATSWEEAPQRTADDAPGPFVVAMASERARIGAAPHGPRVVVVGTRYVLAEENWRQPRPLHGTAFFVDGALAWLTARAPLVDVPDRPVVPAGMRVSEQGRAEVERYVLIFMPLAALLLGAVTWAWRRAAENRPHVPARKRAQSP
jgi:hypothetical protein